MLAGRRMFRATVAAVNAKGHFMSTIRNGPPAQPSTANGQRSAPGSTRKTLWSAVTGALLPAICCHCGARAESSGLDLCAVCTALIPLNHEPRAVLRGDSRAAVRLVVPFLYAYPVDAWVRALKFRGDRLYARVLGELLARARAAMRVEAPELSLLPDLIVPIPLHSSRYRERGFNQAAEIARVAGRALRIPVDASALIRRVATREQSGLSLRERHKNVRGAFEVTRAISVTRVAIVDDVLTTGSTARAAARVLAGHGVEQIELWAAARAVLS